MSKNLIYYFFVSIVSITFIALQTGCKKQDKYPSESLPQIISVNPTSAIPGTPVDIKGMHLSGVTAVRFGTIKALFQPQSDTSLTAIVPDSLPAGILYVQVYVGDGVGYGAQKFTILPAPKIPNIASINPANAFPADTIIISGMNFTAVNAITFGSEHAVYIIDDSSTLKVSIPSDLTTSHQLITVASPTGSDTASYDVNLAPVINSFTPIKATTNDVVTVNGKRFNGTTSVLLGNISSSFNVLNDSVLNFTVSASAVSAFITVTTPNGSGKSNTTLQVY